MTASASPASPDSNPAHNPAKNTAETAWPVAKFNTSVQHWIDRLGWLWIEGQIIQLKTSPRWSAAYMTLRDVEKDSSVSVRADVKLLNAASAPIKEGDRVVVLGKANYYEKKGTFSLTVTDIRHVGIGDLLARIEQLRQRLAAEGLFDASRKQRLPVLPNRIGLITGRDSAAQRDVLSVAQARWPQVDFRIINTAVQGVRTVPEVVAALETLDADPTVDVIIIARGGGSVEDLLPFSEEALVRAVSRARTPVVSAIGHEPDNPVLDNVADLRAATPTDAAKRVVPDAAEELAGISDARARMAGALRGWVQRERTSLRQLRSRPVLADPMRPILRHREDVENAVRLIRRDIQHLLMSEQSRVAGLRGQVAALGPSATLARGYAVVQVQPRDGSEAEVVTSIAQTPPGSQLRIRVADGSITAAGMGTTPAN